MLKVWRYIAFALVLVLSTKEVAATTYVFVPSNSSSWMSTLQGLKAGDTLIFRAGTYSTGSNRLGVSLAGTLDQPILIMGYPGETVTIERPNTAQNIIDIDGSNFVFKNIEFVGGSKGIRFGTSPVSNVLVSHCKVYNTAATAVSCNDNGNTCNNITVEYTEVYNTGNSTSECFYFGCVGGACTTSNSTFRFNYCHDTMNSLNGYGSGFQIKTGSYNNVVYANVCDRTHGPCVLVYDDDFRGPNIVDSNLVMNTGDNGIQATAGVRIWNNIIFNPTYAGIYISAHDPLPITDTPRDIQIIHNTVLYSGLECLYGSSWSTYINTITVANNAFFCSKTFSLQDNQAGAIWAGNAYQTGQTAPAGVAPGGLITVRSASTELLSAPTTGFPNPYPKSSSALIGAGNASHTLPLDFNCMPRSQTSVTIGAYDYVVSWNGVNKGWALADSIRTCSGASGQPNTPMPPQGGSTPSPTSSAASKTYAGLFAVFLSFILLRVCL